MKQKIVVKVTMNNDKSRKKAFKIAAGDPRVTSVSLDEKDNNKLVVTGTNVDAVKLTNKLRKKMKFFCRHFAQLESVTDVDEKEKETEKKKEEEEKYCKWPPPYYYPLCYEMPYEPCQCSIM